MRPYYLRQNCCGYYVVSFTNKETGLRTNYKSTRTKNYEEALQIAMKWYMQGAPEKNKRRPELLAAVFWRRLYCGTAY